MASGLLISSSILWDFQIIVHWLKGILLYKLENRTLLERFTELCPFTHVTQWQDMALRHAPVVMVKLRKIQHIWFSP